MDIFAIIEAKSDTDDQSTAYEHLLLYTRNLYVYQYDRQFTWGFTVCSSILHMCIIVNDKVYSSDKIDFKEPEGRSELVTLLCNMSFCEVDQLGYDPSISFNKIADRWEIAIFDDDEIADDGISEEPVIVKDAWAFVPKTFEGIIYDDPCDEVNIMRKITKALSNDQNFAGMYLILEHGGVVQFADTDGKYTIKDNEEHVIGRLGENAISKNQIHVHKSLAMKLIGEPLYSVRSVDELIIVVADAILVCIEIWKKAKILHRDISDNNILITRIDGWVRGMLIDFDNSLDISDLESLKRVAQQGMIGTLPFMSILNLENHQGGYYTVLDDLESTLYMLCWLAMFGVNAEDQKKDKRTKKDLSELPILKLFDSKGGPQNDKPPVDSAPSATNTPPATNDLPALADPSASNAPPAANDPPAINDPIINHASDKDQVDIIVKDLVEVMEMERDDALFRMYNALLAA
ncbi:hypothetical protein GGI07_004523 [Coemansia sp. Benny D115]|nr:hypothetical protein GGI07_004523 [Coemansia sp. Benny D115]